MFGTGTFGTVSSKPPKNYFEDFEAKIFIYSSQHFQYIKHQSAKKNRNFQDRVLKKTLDGIISFTYSIMSRNSHVL